MANTAPDNTNRPDPRARDNASLPPGHERIEGEAVNVTVRREGELPVAVTVDAKGPNGTVGTFKIDPIPEHLREGLKFYLAEHSPEEGIAAFLRLAEKKGGIEQLGIVQTYVETALDTSEISGKTGTTFTIHRDRSPGSLMEAVDGSQRLAVSATSAFGEIFAPTLNYVAKGKDGKFESIAISIRVGNETVFEHSVDADDLRRLNTKSQGHHLEQVLFAFKDGGEAAVRELLTAKKEQAPEWQEAGDPDEDADFKPGGEFHPDTERAPSNPSHGVHVGPLRLEPHEEDRTHDGTKLRYGVDGPVFTFTNLGGTVRIECHSDPDEGASVITLVRRREGLEERELAGVAREAEKIFDEFKFSPAEKRLRLVEQLQGLGFELHVTEGTAPKFVSDAMRELDGSGLNSALLVPSPHPDARRHLRDTLAGITRCEMRIADAERCDFGTLTLLVNRHGNGEIHISDGIAASASQTVGTGRKRDAVLNHEQVKEVMQAFLLDPPGTALRVATSETGSAVFLPGQRDEFQRRAYVQMDRTLDAFVSATGHDGSLAGAVFFAHRGGTYSPTEFLAPNARDAGLDRVRVSVMSDGVRRLEIVSPNEGLLGRVFGLSTRHVFELESGTDPARLAGLFGAKSPDAALAAARELGGSETSTTGTFNEKRGFTRLLSWLRGE